MKFQFALILFLLSRSTFAVTAIEFGANQNTGYENMTCDQMIKSNFQLQATTGLNEQFIRKQLSKCRDHFWKSERRHCVSDVEILEKKHRNMMNDFVNALGIRVQIYDSLNISDKSKLTHECQNITAQSYMRPQKMNDDEFFRKLYLKCKIQTNVEMDGRTSIEKLYGEVNAKAYADRQLCKNYIYEYTKQLYADPVSQKSPEEKISLAEKNKVVETKACNRISCQQLLSSPTNNPSPCYRHQLLDCMSGGGTSNAAEKSNGSSIGH